MIIIPDLLNQGYHSYGALGLLPHLSLGYRLLRRSPLLLRAHGTGSISLLPILLLLLLLAYSLSRARFGLVDNGDGLL